MCVCGGGGGGIPQHLSITLQAFRGDDGHNSSRSTTIRTASFDGAHADGDEAAPEHHREAELEKKEKSKKRKTKPKLGRLRGKAKVPPHARLGPGRQTGRWTSEYSGAWRRSRTSKACPQWRAPVARALSPHSLPLGSQVFGEFNRAPQNGGGGVQEKASIDRTINQLLRTLAPDVPKIFWSIENGQLVSTECRANDDFAKPPRRADSKESIFIFC